MLKITKLQKLKNKVAMKKSRRFKVKRYSDDDYYETMSEYNRCNWCEGRGCMYCRDYDEDDFRSVDSEAYSKRCTGCNQIIHENPFSGEFCGKRCYYDYRDGV